MEECGLLLTWRPRPQRLDDAPAPCFRPSMFGVRFARMETQSLRRRKGAVAADGWVREGERSHGDPPDAARQSVFQRFRNCGNNELPRVSTMRLDATADDGRAGARNGVAPAALHIRLPSIGGADDAQARSHHLIGCARGGIESNSALPL